MALREATRSYWTSFRLFVVYICKLI